MGKWKECHWAATQQDRTKKAKGAETTREPARKEALRWLGRHGELMYAGVKLHEKGFVPAVG